MKGLPKISIVTVNFNGARYLEETILSVLNQNYPNLEYIIIDGGSKDDSINIIKKYESKLYYWVSEKDMGQYHAIQKGFEKSTGDIMAWINSDDLYVPYAFNGVVQLFNEYPNANWLMGMPREYNEQGVMMSRITLPWARWSKLRYYTYDFQFIQQESCFWRREVWEQAGGKMNLECKYAGDMELWLRFFRKERLHTTTATFAGFRYNSQNQRSIEFRQEYLMECERVINQELQNFSFMKRSAYFVLRILGYFLAPFFFFDMPLLRLVYALLFNIPRVIHYNFETNKFTTRNFMVKLPPLFLFSRQIHFNMFNKKKNVT